MLPFWKNNSNSAFAQHLLDSRHCIGPIYNTVQILHVTNKGSHMNTLEKYHMHKETKKGNHSNDKTTITENKIYGRIYKYETL
jgi:hypothetical protein